MQFGKKTATYAAAAVVAAIAIMAVATLYAGPAALPATTTTPASATYQSQGQMQTTSVISTSSVGGQQSTGAPLNAAPAVFLVQLTDPPVVPPKTTSLNLTYSSIDLLVAERTNNTVTTSKVTISPAGGSATVDLLQLQNVSQTIASANLPNDTTIYSITFTVSSISIDVNGTVSPVTLATGGSTLQVALAKPATLDGTTAALLQLNPIVVSTPTGYELIPSAVGVVRPHSAVSDNDAVIGSKHALTNDDRSDLDQAKGQVSARLVALSASGNTTTVSVQVNNTGSSPVRLVALGLHGNFTSLSPSCTTTTTSTTSTTTSTASTTTTSTSSTHGPGNGQGDENGQNGGRDQGAEGARCNVGNEVVFVPLVPATTSTTTSSAASTSTSTVTTSTTTATSCMTGQMGLINGDKAADNESRGTTLAPGQCITLTFTGAISFGESPSVIVPSTGAGQTYTLHVIASNSAEETLNCALPLTSTSCTVANPRNS